ncbi:Paf1/Rna polymerase II complex component LEO1 [Cardiosporidium cionae]|uniref:Paf1/Rna polymerase II complex component LEO1 n=1 Tax=Cardiosporidium cionae TaxID=476202 RepID=A0ABQ7JAV4_9APIC|nr:Paf1/Rna polymerase II complex component LEO1 [Cardiosporidium cionae]|eukprot:KAF8821122.1 Paf1/Rna polymerase II complex component LEO1 [Cardiosporidium cionae]
MDDHLFGSSSESEGDAVDTKERTSLFDNFEEQQVESEPFQGDTRSAASRREGGGFTDKSDDQDGNNEDKDDISFSYSLNTDFPPINEIEEASEDPHRSHATSRLTASGGPSYYSSKIPFKARPNPLNRRILTVRLPSVVRVLAEACNAHKSHQIAEEESQATSHSSSIRWWVKQDEHGESLTEANGNLQYESNTNLIQWSDGTYSLIIGDKSFDCELRKEMAFIFEDSQENIKPLHCVSKERMQVRLSNIKESLAHYRKATPSQQRTKLTTLEEIESSQLLTQKTLEARRDAERMHRIQANAAKTSGLTGAYLEDDSDES